MADARSSTAAKISGVRGNTAILVVPIRWVCLLGDKEQRLEDAYFYCSDRTPTAARIRRTPEQLKAEAAKVLSTIRKAAKEGIGGTEIRKSVPGVGQRASCSRTHRGY